MNNDFPRELAIKIDRLLDLVDRGQLQPDALQLLQAAYTLRQHGECVRADRCVAIARRLLPSLARSGVFPSHE